MPRQRTRNLTFIPSAYRGPLAQPTVRRLLPGFLVSNLGDGMSFVAIAWLAMGLVGGAGAGMAVGGAVAAYTLGGVFLRGLFTRIGTPRVILLDSVLRAVCLAAVSLLAVSGQLTLGVLIAFLAASSILHALGMAARDTLIAEVLPKEELMAANSLLRTFAQIGMIAGPALAGVLTAVLGPGLVIGLDAASFAVLGVLLIGVARPDSVGTRKQATPKRAVYRELKAQPILGALLALTFMFTFLYGPFEVALPIYVEESLGKSAATLGYLWTALAAGALLAGLVMGAIKRIPLGVALIVIVVGWGAALFAPALTTDVPLVVVSLTLGGIFWGPYLALVTTFLQARIPPERFANFSTAWHSSLLAAAPVGVAIGGPLVTAIGPQDTFLWSAVTTLGLAVVVVVIGFGYWIRGWRGGGRVPVRHVPFPAPIPMKLRTDRLVLRPLQNTDLPVLKRSWTDAQVRTFLGGPLSDEGVSLRIEEGADFFCTLTVLLEENVVGFCRLTRHMSGAVELSYTFFVEYQGYGYAREACGGLLGWISEAHPEEGRVVAVTQAANHRSIRLLEGLGLREMGEFEEYGERQVMFGMDLVSGRSPVLAG